ncbi:Queuine tRNA-ribosyltransferase subunit qtrtd1, partial [Podila humilis]
MSPLTFNIIRQSTQRSAARRGTVVLTSSSSSSSNPSTITSPIDNETTPNRVIETPGCFMYSVKGSVPHLTPDTLRLQGFGGVGVSIEQLIQDHQPSGLEKWPFTLSKFLNLQDLILFCDIRDSSSFVKAPFNTDRYVSMISHQGVRQLSLEDYLKVLRVYQPDIVGCFSDSISDSKEPGPKRVKKSVDRSLKWLDQVLLERQGLDGLAQEREADEKRRQKIKNNEIHTAKKNKENQKPVATAARVTTTTTTTTTTGGNAAATANTIEVPKRNVQPFTDVGLFAHVQGANLEHERIRSAQETAKRAGLDGFIIDTNTLPGSRDDVIKLLKVSLDQLPSEKPRLVYGMQAPEDILRSIALGADLFDTSYPFLLTEDGKASLFSFGTNLTSTSTPLSSTSSSQQEVSKTGDTNIKNYSDRWINLWDDIHADKFIPIMNDCECYACKGGRHTRAYINHLLKAHEMLATVLLMSHNMHQYSKFFTNIRQSIVDGTFDQLSQQFREQFGNEPERTGEIHEAQRVVEASLSKRNRLDSADSGSGSSSSSSPSSALLVTSNTTPEELEAAREARKLERTQRLQDKKQRQLVNKKEKRAQKLKERAERKTEEQEKEKKSDNIDAQA